MPQSITILSFLLLKVSLIAYAQTVDFNTDSLINFFRNGSLPIRCNVRFGVDWFGNDLTTRRVSNDNPGECCTLCRELPGCRAWVWRSKDGPNCWLKDSVTRPILCPVCVGGIFHDVIRDNCNPREGMSFSGPNLEVRIGTTIGDCCDACIQTQNCTGWTFRNTTNPRCFLKQRNEQETNCTDCTSGVDEYNISVNETCNARPDVDWFAGDINDQPYLNANAEECCGLCQNNTNCTAWLYRGLFRHCYLKHTVNEESQCLDCIGGILR